MRTTALLSKRTRNIRTTKHRVITAASVDSLGRRPPICGEGATPSPMLNTASLTSDDNNRVIQI